MEWTEVNIYTATEGIEILCSKLEDLGVKGFSIRDAEDFKEFLDNKYGRWDYIDDDLMGLSECETCITIYLPANEQGQETLTAVRSMLAEMKAADTEGKYGRLEAELASLREEDWANNWKQYFKPFVIGERLAIKPSWEEFDNTDGRVVLEIDPASSFGTGTHHTTRLCLELIEKYLKNGSRGLDLGCGSGILSIAALILGAKDAIAVDIDPIAETIAYENAALNGIGKDRYTVLTGDVLTDSALREKIEAKRYPIVTANIVASVIIALAPYAAKLLEEGGKFITSGIIDTREDEVAAALTAAGLNILEIRRGGDWRAILAEKCA